MLATQNEERQNNESCNVKCENCGKMVKGSESRTYCETKGRWIGKIYYRTGADCWTLCKLCYKKWDEERNRKLKILGIIILAVILGFIALIIWVAVSSQ